MVGRTLGHYRVLARLGAGGMGEVYRAHDATLGRDVAIKVLPEAVASDPDRLRRLRREAHALASLSHPGVVTIYSVEEADGVHFLTMELVSGRPLSELIPTHGLPPGRLFELGAALAEAVAAAHDKGVVHRDLKPANVMVADDGRLKVLDFGLAALQPPESEETCSHLSLEPLTEAGTAVGTVPYMSPEQLQGHPADARSDVFALGIVLYQMACGHRPFAGDSTAEVFSSILRDAPAPLAPQRGDLPERLDRIVARCLHKEPRERYQSVTDLAHDLAELRTESAPVPAAPAPPLGGGERKSRRRWWAAAVAAVVALAALGAFLLRRGPASSQGGGSAAIRSIAVLPFTNMMKDPSQGYFVDGMQETLLTTLAKIGSLRVISRTSVMQYRGTTKTVPEIARELGVDAVIEGSVLRDGNRVRITAQLIRGATDAHLWAQSYDRNVENVLGLLSEVAEAIAGEVKVALTPEQKGILRAQDRPVLVDAQEAFLRGQQELNLFTAAGREKALAYFRQALDLDPRLAPAWAGLASTELARGLFDGVPLEEAKRRATDAAKKALDIDPTQGSAWGILGYIALYFDWDWPTAAEDLKRAVELDPTNATIRHGYADLLLVEGRLEESLDQVRLGREHDPLLRVANGVVVGHLLFARRFDEALKELNLQQKMFPDARWITFRFAALWQLGRREEALALLRQGWKERFPDLVSALDEGLAEGGPRGAVLAIARAEEPMLREGETTPLDVAHYYALGGDADHALPLLERALEERAPFLLHIKADPSYDPIRADPRFQSLIRRIGFPG